MPTKKPGVHRLVRAAEQTVVVVEAKPDLRVDAALLGERDLSVRAERDEADRGDAPNVPVVVTVASPDHPSGDDRRSCSALRVWNVLLDVPHAALVARRAQNEVAFPDVHENRAE